MIVILLVMGFPLVYTFLLSLYKNDVFTDQMKYVGFAQFAKLIRDPVFILSIKNTLVWTLACVLFQFLIGFFAAVTINLDFIKGRTLIRILIMVPWVLPSIIGVNVWKWSYHPDFGIINSILQWTGIISKNITWTSAPQTSLLSAVVVNVWKMFPFVMLMIEAALQSVPRELKDAARVDGARVVRTFFTVTVPHIFTTSLTIVLLLTIWAFNAFTFIFVLTEGGPAHKSEILSMYIYRQSFQNYNFGMASAASVTLFAITAVFSFIYIKFFLRKDT